MADGGNFGTICAQMPAQPVNDKEKAALIYMREEEKLAHDIYVTLFEKWNLRAFQNISKSETRHTKAIKALLKKYKIDDPVKSNEVGTFTNPELGELFKKLVAQGEKSLKDALIVGATIEDLDIADLHERMSETDNDDIKCVFDRLTQGSENHMRAFMRQLQANGSTYKAQYISQTELEEIINSASQRSRGGKGRYRSF